MRTQPTCIDQLDELKNQFDPDAARRVRATYSINSPAEVSTIRIRSFVTTRSCCFCARIRTTQQLCARPKRNCADFPSRVSALREQEIDLCATATSGSFRHCRNLSYDTFSFYIVRWLLQRHSSQVAIDWEWFEDENRLAATWPRFMPLLEEDALVEANVPYREWLAGRAAMAALNSRWLVERLTSCPNLKTNELNSTTRKSSTCSWTPRFSATRTGMRLPPKAVLLSSRSFNSTSRNRSHKELDQPSPPLQKLSLKAR